MEEVTCVGKSVLLNHSSDGVSCDTEWNLTIMINYLEGRSKHLSFPDINQNIKKGRYQMLEGSCAAIIVFFVLTHGC